MIDDEAKIMIIDDLVIGSMVRQFLFKVWHLFSTTSGQLFEHDWILESHGVSYWQLPINGAQTWHWNLSQEQPLICIHSDEHWLKCKLWCWSEKEKLNPANWSPPRTRNDNCFSNCFPDALDLIQAWSEGWKHWITFVSVGNHMHPNR